MTCPYCQRGLRFVFSFDLNGEREERFRCDCGYQESRIQYAMQQEKRKQVISTARQITELDELRGAICRIDIALNGDGERTVTEVITAAENWHGIMEKVRAVIPFLKHAMRCPAAHSPIGSWSGEPNPHHGPCDCGAGEALTALYAVLPWLKETK